VSAGAPMAGMGPMPATPLAAGGRLDVSGLSAEVAGYVATLDELSHAPQPLPDEDELAAAAELALAAEAALPLAAELAAELVGELAGELPAEAAARRGALAAGARDRLPDCVDKHTSLRPGSTKVTRPMRVLFAALPARGNSCGRRICLQQRAGVLGQARMLTS